MYNVLLFSSQIMEHHWNLAKIFNMLNIDDIFATFENVVLTGDLKILNEIEILRTASIIIMYKTHHYFKIFLIDFPFSK